MSRVFIHPPHTQNRGAFSFLRIWIRTFFLQFSTNFLPPGIPNYLYFFSFSNSAVLLPYELDGPASSSNGLFQEISLTLLVKDLCPSFLTGWVPFIF